MIITHHIIVIQQVKLMSTHTTRYQTTSTLASSHMSPVGTSTWLHSPTNNAASKIIALLRSLPSLLLHCITHAALHDIRHLMSIKQALM
jgi:hypothetical protein